MSVLSNANVCVCQQPYNGVFIIAERERKTGGEKVTRFVRFFHDPDL